MATKELTPRQLEAARAYVTHGTIPAAADVLGVKPRTAQYLVGEAVRKLGAANARGLYAVMSRAGLLEA